MLNLLQLQFVYDMHNLDSCLPPCVDDFGSAAAAS